MIYLPKDLRYNTMHYHHSGKWSLKLPTISLCLWHYFDGIDKFENGCAMLHQAFVLGITHFDLANDYDPHSGSAEKTFGKILRQDFKAYHNELIISSKADYRIITNQK